jgi:hypothetical protein
MPMQKIGHMSLKNDGGFVARIQIAYLDDDGYRQMSRQSDDVTLGASRSVEPSSLGVPDGSICYLSAFVVWGTDNTAGQAFYYDKGNSNSANYSISGTTLSNDLGLIGIS